MRKSTHSAKYKRLIALLRDARRLSKVTQTDLAKRLKRPQSFVAKYEQGERRLDVVEFVAVAEALGTDPVKMLKASGIIALKRPCLSVPESDR
jgi:transcriptional regulator with XRE-family HTH domain